LRLDSAGASAPAAFCLALANFFFFKKMPSLAFYMPEQRKTVVHDYNYNSKKKLLTKLQKLNKLISLQLQSTQGQTFINNPKA